MAERFVMRALTHPTETEAIVDRIGQWFDVDRPDGFFDVKEIDNHVDIDDDDQPWACVTFEAADAAMADFMVSLAAQECGLTKTVQVVAV